MLDISWAELLFIAVVAIIVIGPKDLPRALRTVGQWTGRAKRVAGDFQRQFNEAIREAELDTVKDTVNKVGKGTIDPLGSVRKEFTKIETDIKDDLNKAAGTDKASGDGKVAEASRDKGAAGVAAAAVAGTPKPEEMATSPDLIAPDTSPDAEAHQSEAAEATESAAPKTPEPHAKKEAAVGDAKS